MGWTASTMGEHVAAFLTMAKGSAALLLGISSSATRIPSSTAPCVLSKSDTPAMGPTRFNRTAADTMSLAAQYPTTRTVASADRPRCAPARPKIGPTCPVVEELRSIFA